MPRKATARRSRQAMHRYATPVQNAADLVGAMASKDSGIRFVLGIAHRAGKRVSEAQSVIFDKLKWTADAAKVWLRDHGFSTPKVDEGATFWRFRQQDPKHYKEFRTVVPGTRQGNPQLKFGRTPYDLVPDKLERYHVVNDGGYIVAKHDTQYIADDDARMKSEDEPSGSFQVVDTRTGQTVSKWDNGEERDVEENPGPWPTVYKTRKAAQAAWYDSMPGRNDHATYKKVRGGYRVVPEGHFGGRGHFGTTVDDMERGDTGFVENPIYDQGRFPEYGGSGGKDATYRVRFIRPDQAGELMDLWHLARTALSGGDASNYNRMLWASKEFSKAHPEVSPTAAYKDLEGLRSNWFGARNPTPGEAITAYDEHLATTLDPAFAAATPDEQAAAMTVQDATENPYHGWSVQEESPISGWHTVSNWITHEGADHQAKLLSEDTGKTHRVMHKDSGRVYQTFGGARRENPSGLGQAAFDAAKDFRLSGAYYETGVANARVAGYGFTKWYPGPTKGYRKATLKRNWMEGWAAGKRVEKKQAKANPESPAAALYEDFHGRPSAETLEIVTERNEHEWLTGLGTLVELKVATVTQLDATISFARDKKAPELCSSEDGRQLYIEGGNQEVPLKSLKMDGPKFEKDSMVLGILTEVTYHTSKGFHKFRPTDYYHRLGEESGLQPTLLYDPRNKLLSISGGAYRVEDIGIVD